MKRLIVNADDVGADKARNEGIFAAIEAGIITSVSIWNPHKSFRGQAALLRSQAYHGAGWQLSGEGGYAAPVHAARRSGVGRGNPEGS
jgi:predicted glycoside hydrolase/deacetylase ChbG (UPF0249 family)